MVQARQGSGRMVSGASLVSGYGTSADLGHHRFVLCFEALCYGGARGRQPWRPSLEGSLERPRGSKTLDGLSRTA